MLEKNETDFAAWMRQAGYNRRQVDEAGYAIGMGSQRTIRDTYNNVRGLNTTERLAMSAVRAGLQPWTRSYDAELVAKALPSELEAEIASTIEKLVRVLHGVRAANMEARKDGEPEAPTGE